MQFAYFTKLLQGMSLAETAEFLQSAGLNGPDLTVRDGFSVNPNNVRTALPEAKKIFADRGLTIPMVTASTNLIDASTAEAKRLFESCAEQGVSAIKIGYFRYAGDYQRDLDRARESLEGFSRLAEKTGVQACYHTHSGSYIGSNCAGLRALLEHVNPQFVGAFVDTGHQTIGGAPFRMALDMVSRWLTLLAIKDMAWTKSDRGWKRSVVPAGEGIADWREIAQAVKEQKFDGLISLHAEYHVYDPNERLELAKQELAFLKSRFENK